MGLQAYAFYTLAVVLITLGIRNLSDEEIVTHHGKGQLIQGLIVLGAWYFILL